MRAPSRYSKAIQEEYTRVLLWVTRLVTSLAYTTDKSSGRSRRNLGGYTISTPEQWYNFFWQYNHMQTWSNLTKPSATACWSPVSALCPACDRIRSMAHSCSGLLNSATCVSLQPGNSWSLLGMWTRRYEEWNTRWIPRCFKQLGRSSL